MSRKYQSLDTDLLAQLFRERIKNPKCPFCEHEEWALPLPTGATGVVLPWARGDEYIMPGNPIVMLYCKNCGFIRLHSLDALDGVLPEPDVIEVGPGSGGEQA